MLSQEIPTDNDIEKLARQQQKKNLTNQTCEQFFLHIYVCCKNEKWKSFTLLVKAVEIFPNQILYNQDYFCFISSCPGIRLINVMENQK